MVRILVVDDDPFVLMFGDALLQQPGRTVMTAASGADALGFLARPAPDLVLLDVGLPDLSGLEVLRVMRGVAAWDRTRILMLTASHDLDDIVKARQGGASGYVCKPVQPDTLAAMVADILEQEDLVWLDDYTRARRPG
jgi:DNA-binding response OmpR family regulator